jgi:hypothetical protein
VTRFAHDSWRPSDPAATAPAWRSRASCSSAATTPCANSATRRCNPPDPRSACAHSPHSIRCTAAGSRHRRAATSAWTASNDRAAAQLPPAGITHKPSCRRPAARQGRGPRYGWAPARTAPTPSTRPRPPADNTSTATTKTQALDASPRHRYGRPAGARAAERPATASSSGCSRPRRAGRCARRSSRAGVGRRGFGTLAARPSGRLRGGHRDDRGSDDVASASPGEERPCRSRKRPFRSGRVCDHVPLPACRWSLRSRRGSPTIVRWQAGLTATPPVTDTSDCARGAIGALDNARDLDA